MVAAARNLLKDTDPQAEPIKSPPNQASSELFSNVLDEYVAKHLQRHNKPSTAKETERILRHDFEKHDGPRSNSGGRSVAGCATARRIQP